MEGASLKLVNQLTLQLWPLSAGKSQWARQSAASLPGEVLRDCEPGSEMPAALRMGRSGNAGHSLVHTDGRLLQPLCSPDRLGDRSLSICSDFVLLLVAPCLCGLGGPFAPQIRWCAGRCRSLPLLVCRRAILPCTQIRVLDQL